MLLLSFDEDLDTVRSVLSAIALQNGLEPADAEADGADILSLALGMLGPHVALTPGEDFVLVEGLASLDVGDARALGVAVSAACGNSVVAIEPTANGIRVATFDDGEEEASVDVDLDGSGTTRSPALAEIAPTDEAGEELTRGVAAMNAIELAHQVLRLWGAGEDQRTGAPTMMTFHDPDADDDDDEGEGDHGA
ncbi:MAG: hypothetical protein JNL38_10895 [Myxococcales bacterium]|nr:hypothetical protein [Myxococcales bacterium]